MASRVNVSFNVTNSLLIQKNQIQLMSGSCPSKLHDKIFASAPLCMIRNNDVSSTRDLAALDLGYYKPL